MSAGSNKMVVAQESAGKRGVAFYQTFGRSFIEFVSSQIAPFRSEVNHPVSNLDNLRIVFDDKNGMTSGNQSIHGVQ